MKRFIIKTAEIRARASAAVMAIRGEENMEVIIQPHKDDQTGEQRRFFHVLCRLLADELGESPDAIKQIIKAECWGVETVTVGELTVDVIKPSSSAKKDEYSELIETAYRVGAWSGIVLPNPYWKG